MRYIKAGKVIIGDGKQVLTNGYVAIDEMGIICEVGETGAMKPKAEDAVECYENGTLLPGMIDMHCHIAHWWREDQSQFNDTLIGMLTYKNMQTAFSKGVTMVRDAMCSDGVLVAMQRASERGYAVLPRIKQSNQAIISTGGHCHNYTRAVEVADGAEEVRRAVRSQVLKGADWIKVMGNDGYKKGYSPLEMEALADECRRVGIKSMVHASIEDSIESAVQAGFDTIEHGTFMTDEQAKMLIDKGLAWTPTLAAYFYWAEKTRVPKGEKGDAFYGMMKKKSDFFERSLDAYRERIKKYFDMGMRIVAGTDVGITPIYDEVRLMHELGLDPLQAVNTATGLAAEVLGLGRELGLLKKGYIADLAVVNGDVLKDIRALEDVQATYLAGNKVFEKQA